MNTVNEISYEALVREIKRAQAAGKIEFSEDGTLMVLPQANLEVGGVFHSWVLRHEAVQRAIEDGDPERESWIRESLLRNGAEFSDRGYFRTMDDSSHNLIPDAGINTMLELVFKTATTKISNWYQGPFKTNVTPAAAWVSNWSGADGAAPGAELVPTTDYTVAARVEAVFAAASAKKIACAATQFTLASGAADITLYGSTLNSISTAAYNVADKVLAAATKFSTAKSGLGAGDKILIEYEITGASS